MNRLIDADALEHWTYEFYSQTERGRFISAIRNAPTVDAVPVVRGKWVKVKREDLKGYECSNCEDFLYDSTFYENDYYYCPNCGAKMEGGE